jgi:hypothetical protein
MSALDPDERRRYDGLRSRITASVRKAVSTSTSFRFQLDASVPLSDIAEWMSLEHRCCPFMNIGLVLRPDQTRWVELGGSAAIKDFLREEFAGIIS